MTNTSLLTTRSSRMRNVNAKTSNLSLASTISINLNNELSSKAANNGFGIVYHRSDCNYPQVNSYGAGGRFGGVGCGYWVSTIKDKSFSYYESNGEYISVSTSDADLVWYGMPDSQTPGIFGVPITARNVAYKIIGPDYNWNIDELNKYR